MDKVYDHKHVESKWYSFWENGGLFSPKSGRKYFSIILPPPNANGRLHIGHAMYVIEDIMIRYHRLLGDSTLWLPGADHAGILTQVVYERELEKKGQSRHHLGREEFFKQTYQFTQENKKQMYAQLRAMGFSLDWSREKFTLDTEISKAVYQTFKLLYDDGLIYQGNRMINWCPRCTTVLSDLEVSHTDKTSSLWYIKYPLKDSTDFVVVATTRPETMLGDAAVAVNPNDTRYKALVGKTAVLPLLNRDIPIIADSFVDQEFGTGAVKITPAHDPNDYEIGERHSLPKIQVIGMDDKMTKEAGKYVSADKYATRKQVLADLESQGLVERVERHRYNIGVCERCDTIIEPQISKQWFVAMNKTGKSGKTLAKDALKAVKSGKIKIIPERFEKIYYNWMGNLHDWCISRQIWWGHQIPVWYKEDEVYVGIEPPKGPGWFQDTDTLDTWFSSGQWPFTTLGWGQKDDSDFEKFYPTSVMETGYDILFFWVARMIMLGLYVTNDVPFKTVYLHGLVRDERGQKMSKSKNNVIDPLNVAGKYGADAVRMALVFGTGPGNDTNLGESKIRGMRNFTNKLWNVGRFIIDMKPEKIKPHPKKTKEDEEILEKLKRIKKLVTHGIENYHFGIVAEMLYNFIWHDFADKYVEHSKPRREDSQPILEEVFEEYLRLLHPFMPFITEDLWQRLPNKSGQSIMVSGWPKRN
ncbi:MAG: valine--tRNA ligase [bacterium]|nr:valine--tRNA ligase [bacterium]